MCIDEAEGVVAHREHRLERLLTQKNMFADDALVCSVTQLCLVQTIVMGMKICLLMHWCAADKIVSQSDECLC